MFVERVANTRLLSSTVLYGLRRLSCASLIVHTNPRDSLQIIDHSSGDVAYLRINAHTENKSTTNELQVSLQPILDTKFQNVFDVVKNIPAYPAAEVFEKSDNWSVNTPKLVQIATGVYVTNTIATKILSSVEQDISYCLDQLLCTLNQIL